jgi:cytochrome c oxidase subunit 2
MAGKVDALYFYLTGVSIFFTLLIVVVITFFAIRYRRRTPHEIPRPIAGSLALETMWSVVPFVIAMSMFVWGAGLYFQQFRQPEAAMDIYVVGKQWMWKFQHLTGQREINELHVPVGRKIKLTMTTEDVIHDLFIPAFRTKMDAVPGKYTYEWFEATTPGRYHLFCAQYCGMNHSLMGGWVIAMEPADFNDWLSGNANQQSPVAAGQALFQQKLGCASCHGENGQGGRGPSLINLVGSLVPLDNGQKVTADDAYLRESILAPQAKIVAGYQPIMPTFQGQIKEEELLQLIAFVKSLSPGKSTEAPSATAPAHQEINKGGAGQQSPSPQRNANVSATPNTNKRSGQGASPVTGGSRSPSGGTVQPPGRP